MVSDLVAGPSILQDLWAIVRPAAVLILAIVVEEIVLTVLHSFRRLLGPGVWPLFHLVLLLLLRVGLVAFFLGSLLGFTLAFATSLTLASASAFSRPGMAIIITWTGMLPLRLVGTSPPARCLLPPARRLWSRLSL